MPFLRKILHLTHTDIKADPRILKELKVLSRNAGDSVVGLGIKDQVGKALESSIVAGVELKLIELKSKKFRFLPTTIRHIFSFFELTYKFLAFSVKFKPDIVHCHDVIVLPLGFFVKIFSGAKLIYDAHELESDRNGITRVQGFLTKSFEKVLWPFIDRLIVVSDSIGSWYNKNIGIKEYSIILNSPEIKAATEIDKSYLRSKFRIGADEKIFIYVGILGRGRGIDLILKAFSDPKRCSSAVFLGYGDLVGEIKELSAKNKNIYYHEPVQYDEVVSVASSADYGFCLIQNVSLSDYLCLPNKLFEYCFAGVPVIASNFPEIEKITNKYNLGFCVELELEAIVKIIAYLETLEVKPSIDKNVIKDLSWDAQAKKLELLYQGL